MKVAPVSSVMCAARGSPTGHLRPPRVSKERKAYAKSRFGFDFHHNLHNN